MTFGALKNAEADDKDSDDEEGQRFYAGGSITSGQQVIGPPRNNTDIITDMFQTAQKYLVFHKLELSILCTLYFLGMLLIQHQALVAVLLKKVDPHIFLVQDICWDRLRMTQKVKQIN